MRPVIALLTDFGTRDHYVAAMKGVMLGICPDAALVDITHDIPPQDIHAAALTLADCHRDFPPATVFLVVVDPGVGSPRRAIAMDVDGYRYVAPDNGVLSLAVDVAASVRAVEIREPQYMRAAVSRTFEGRDRFAPAAAWLAAGTELSALGPAVEDWVRLEAARPTVSQDRIEGEVARVDRFGNLITNIDRALVEDLRRRGTATVSVGAHQLSRWVTTYTDAAAGDVCLLFSSSNRLEIAANGDSAAARLDVGLAALVVVSLNPSR